MAKDNPLADLLELPGDELSIGGVSRPSRELRRSWEDYSRTREAVAWMRSLEPDNDVALAMMGKDLARRESDLRAALVRVGRSTA